MEELDIPHPEVIEIGVDAAAAISFANNTSTMGRIKHIGMRCDWVRILRDSGNLVFKNILGIENPSDFMTKILTAIKLRIQNEERVHKVEHNSD